MRYVKHNYSKQKPFWLLVNSMCNRGHTAKAAISLIYEVYGESQTVSYILKRIRKDKGKNPLFHATYCKLKSKIKNQETYFCLHI